jgi:hypothetical protein
VIKYETFIIKTFDQLKNDNFDQVNFGQTTPCTINIPAQLAEPILLVFLVGLHVHEQRVSLE